MKRIVSIILTCMLSAALCAAPACAEQDWRSAYLPLIDQANALRPDLARLGGDLAETAQDQAEALPILARLSAPLGAYAVMGNNDYHHTRIEGRALTDCLRDAGI